jgi:WD40 repeat protein
LEVVAEGHGHAGPVTAVCHQPTDFTHMASGSNYTTIRLWSFDGGSSINCEGVIETTNKSIQAVAMNSSGNRLLSKWNQVVSIWDIATLALINMVDDSINACEWYEPQSVEIHEDYLGSFISVHMTGPVKV